MNWLVLMRKILRVKMLGALMLFAILAPSSLAQAVEPGQPPSASMPGGQRQRDAEAPWTEDQKRELAKKQNLQRQKDIQKDTDQLLDLAAELKAYVDKTNENIISLEVIKKAEQIEKLAKSVKEKMKGM
jgi:hypothetical protein